MGKGNTGIAASAEEADNRYIFSDVQLLSPGVRTSYKIKRDVRITEPIGTIHLESQTIRETFRNGNILTPVFLNDCEIHVVWRSLCPSTIYTQDMEMSLDFDVSTTLANQIIQMGKFPMNLFVKAIFHPGHSIRLGRSDIIPWSISYNIPGLDIEEGYKLGQIDIEVRGYISPVLTSVQPHVPEIIPLCPQDIIPSGNVFFRPRIPKDGIWVKRKISIKSSNTLNEKMTKLASMGYDVEGLRTVGLLTKVLKMIPASGQMDKDIRKTINKMIGVSELVHNFETE
ncbi:TPA_asm: protein 3 [Torreya virus 1]|uniref:Protein 3 n=1 Tax=Torreya virus 1 TaxID=2977995 RepID=A0A9N6YIY9_9RHAB|nr:TPA_asm: protein 3 [Torreya virus 1]